MGLVVALLVLAAVLLLLGATVSAIKFLLWVAVIVALLAIVVGFAGRGRP